ncbi:MAG TPA: uroporphyrinogen decarboxylase [Alphaproteobacteria bacterium]|nr:uroporphyrinogen decarboxylase [Alphaproteobacteria bacterium]
MSVMNAANKPFLAALGGKNIRPAPIWLMRQAGRYLPEYRALREKARDFLDFCFTPELAIEATVQPIRRYGLDAAILFSDILTVPWALGQKVAFVEGEGPKLEPLRTPADLDRLRHEDVPGKLQPVYDTVAGVAQLLPKGTALIGFAGAPWTVAAYMVEGNGSRDFAQAKGWAMADPDGFGRLIAALVDATVTHLGAQIAAGAEAVQLFDSWAGVLGEAEFRRWVIQPTRSIVDRLQKRYPGIRIIGFPRGAGGMLGPYAREAGVTVVGLDTQAPLDWAISQVPRSMPLQGNLDPVALVTGGPVLRDRTRAILDAMQGRPFVFNLGHGVPMTTPPEHVAELVRLVRA